MQFRLQKEKKKGDAFSSLCVVLNRLLKRLVCNQAYPFHIFAKTIPLFNQGQFRLEKNNKKKNKAGSPVQKDRAKQIPSSPWS